MIGLSARRLLLLLSVDEAQRRSKKKSIKMQSVALLNCSRWPINSFLIEFIPFKLTPTQRVGRLTLKSEWMTVGKIYRIVAELWMPVHFSCCRYLVLAAKEYINLRRRWQWRWWFFTVIDLIWSTKSMDLLASSDAIRCLFLQPAFSHELYGWMDRSTIVQSAFLCAPLQIHL